MVELQVQSKSKGLRTRRAYSAHDSLRSSRLVNQEEPTFQFRLQSKKRLMFQLNQTGRRSSHLLSLFILCRPPTDWMGPTHLGEGNLLYLA